MSGEHSAKKMHAVVSDSQHYKRVVLSLQIFNAKKTFTDMCFVCARGHKVYAHKLLFCTVSSLLKEMFLEIQDNLQTIFVHLPDIEARMMELLLDFLYEGSVRVNQHEYTDFQGIMDTLGIVLTPPESNQAGRSVTQQTAQPVLQPQQQLQAPQLVYMPTAPNTQGQVQYVLAAPGQLNQAQVLQAPLMSPVLQQPTGQMVQNGAQVISSQVQQGSMMQMVQQNNTPMVAGSQIVNGGQMVQCSSQMVVQGNQQSIISNNQMQVGMQSQVAQSNYTTNQPVQQQPQYVVMSSNSNQLPVQQQPHHIMSSNNQLATSRAPTQYHQSRAQGVGRTRPTLPPTQIHHPTRLNSEEDGGHKSLVENIKSILQENSADPDCLTARKIRESLEQRLDRDLAHMEQDIEFVLKSFEAEEDEHLIESAVSVSGCSVGDIKESKEFIKLLKPKKKRKVPYAAKSDDEADEDFDPKKEAKKSVSRPRKKRSS